MAALAETLELCEEVRGALEADLKLVSKRGQGKARYWITKFSGSLEAAGWPKEFAREVSWGQNGSLFTGISFTLCQSGRGRAE
jgi:hypothetical protein